MKVEINLYSKAWTVHVSSKSGPYRAEKYKPTALEQLTGWDSSWEIMLL